MGNRNNKKACKVKKALKQACYEILITVISTVIAELILFAIYKLINR